MVVDERREFTRIGASLPLRCAVLPQRTKKFNTVSRDFSIGGMQILSEHFLARGKQVKVNMSLIHSLANLKAQVAWCAKKPYADGYLIGLEFLEMTKEHKNNLRYFIEEI